MGAIVDDASGGREGSERCWGQESPALRARPRQMRRVGADLRSRRRRGGGQRWLGERRLRWERRAQTEQREALAEVERWRSAVPEVESAVVSATLREVQRCHPSRRPASLVRPVPQWPLWLWVSCEATVAVDPRPGRRPRKGVTTGHRLPSTRYPPAQPQRLAVSTQMSRLSGRLCPHPTASTAGRRGFDCDRHRPTTGTPHQHSDSTMSPQEKNAAHTERECTLESVRSLAA